MRLLVALASLLAWATIASAQGVQSNEVSSPEIQASSFIVSVETAGRSVLSEPLSLIVRLENKGGSVLTVQQLSVAALGQLKRIYVDDCQFDRNPPAGFLVGRGEVVVVSCELRPSSTASTNLLLSKDKEFSIQSTVKVASQSFAQHGVYQIKVGRPEYQVVWGGAVGVLLLAIFLAVRVELIASPEWDAVDKDLRTHFRDSLCSLKRLVFYWPKRIFIGVVGGGVTALMLMAVLNGAHDISTPLSVHLEDFLDGVTLGVFSMHISRWLAEKVKDAKPSASQSSTGEMSR